MTDVRRLFEAMDRRDPAAIYEVLVESGAFLDAPRTVECDGCGHPVHEPLACLSEPLFGRDRRCRCHFGPLSSRMAA